MRKISKIIFHCSATKEGVDISAATVRSWHVLQKSKGGPGFADIGYHYFVRLDGKIEKGRADAVPGAHVEGHNSNSIGVCYAGGLDANGKPKDTRTPAQRRALRALADSLTRQYPGAEIHSHWEYAAKACPCFDAGKEYIDLQPPHYREAVEKRKEFQK